jgi:hypothetical protein
MQAQRTVSVLLQDEGASAPVSIEVGESLAVVLGRAVRLSPPNDRFPISFSSLLIGLFASPDATGTWLRKRYPKIQAGIDRLLAGRNLAWPTIVSMAEANATADLSVLQDTPSVRTVSAARALDEAVRRAREEQVLPEPSHLLEAVLTLPGYHEDDFKELGVERPVWAKEFAGERRAQAGASAAPSKGATAGAWTLQLADSGVESHVLDALRQAAQLANVEEITCASVLTAAAQLAAQTKSAAFLRLAELLGGASATPTPAPTLEVPYLQARLSPALREALTWAQQPASPDAKPQPLWGRDLVTAALLGPDEEVGPAAAAASRDLSLLRDQWYAFATADTARRGREQWAAWWQSAGVPLPGPRRAGYALETDEGDDKLGIGAEAAAFARLILDKDVQPPLSIGLLGDWGSGKSFFIEQIKKSVAAFREEGRPELHRHVVEIEFNAWHASDANLWASLITEIFDRIWDSVRPPEGTGAEAREALRRRVEEARGAVHQAEVQVQLGERALELAEQELKKKQELLALNGYLQKEALEKLQELVQATGWHQSIDTIKDVEIAARELATSGNRLRTLVTVLLHKPVRHIAVPTAAVLAVTAGVWLLVDVSALQGWEQAASKALATVAGFVGSLIAPLRTARSWLDKLAAELDRVNQAYNKELEQARGSPDKERVKQAEQVDKARRELESAQASVETAKARLAELLTQQAAMEPMQRLGAFIQERVQSTQYRSQQGIISLVHKDFRELSRFMKDLRDAKPTGTSPGADEPSIRPIDRIVLYVDDLDRCRPAHVVNMLEAVHLLLALDLFVVIVAVDSRWLTRSLDVYYSDLLGAKENGADGLRASTAQNYLEKIFQITYALAPMNPRHFQGYVDFLTQQSTGESGPPAQSKVAAAPAVPPADQGAQPTGASAPVKTSSASAPPGLAPSSAKVAKADGRASRPSSMPVQFGKEEREFIGRLVPLLPTPRIAKRLVNVYRVLKAGKSPDELDAFVRERRVQPCLLMLAILFGRPLIASDLLRGLAERSKPFDNEGVPLHTAIHDGPPLRVPSGMPAEEWGALAETLKGLGVAATVGECAREVVEVARYSLVTGHEWHTWRHGRREHPAEMV